MGRYFNDDMTEDQNDDYDAYLEHYGIPKEKWDATVRARFDQLHHKAKDGYKSISDGAKKFGSKTSKQIKKTKNYFTKPTHLRAKKVRPDWTEVSPETDFQYDARQTGKNIKKTIKKTGNKIAKAAEKAGIYKPQKTYYVDDDGKKTLLNGKKSNKRKH